jgi:hypothetical protein
MALFNECMQECARKGLDTADIARDGDFSPAIRLLRLRGRPAPCAISSQGRSQNTRNGTLLDSVPLGVTT